MVFEEFYDYKLFSKDYMYRRNWIGCSYMYQKRPYYMRFEHYIASHGKIFKIVINVHDRSTGKEISGFSVREVSRKQHYRKEDIESNIKREFIIAVDDVKDLTVDELYELIVESSLSGYLKNYKLDSLLRGPSVSHNQFVDHINYHFERIKVQDYGI